MRCEELREWLSAELDGEARGAKCAAVRKHLSECADCQQAWASAQGLRLGLAQAAWAPPDEARDAALLHVLRHAGMFREAAGGESQRLEAPKGRIGGWGNPLSSLWLCGFHRVWSMESLRPAAVAMAVSFLLTWGSLRWAATGPAVIPAASGSLAPTAHARPLDAEMLDEWMAGAPTLAALSRLQRLPASVPAAPAPIRRGAMAREPRRVG